MKAEIKALLEKKKWKGKDFMIGILIVGALCAVLAFPTGEKDTINVAEEITKEEEFLCTNDYETELENRLEEILSQMEGVGRVEVMITLEASSREVIEKDLSVSENKSGETMGTISDSSLAKEEVTVYSDTTAGNIPYVVQEIYPEVEGVLVVAEGGGDSYVNLAITDAIQALFGVDVHKIKIVKMNTN